MKWRTPRACAAAAIACLAYIGGVGLAYGQASTPTVRWQLDVIENGVTVDTFKADTPLEQTQTQSREHEVVHAVGCAQVPQARASLSRSIAVTPSSVDERGVSFAIDATETLEDPASQHTSEGCTLPPQPRVVHATHPALIVGKTNWTDWTVVAHDPTLVYRLQASVLPAADDEGTRPAASSADAGSATESGSK
ncbi:hypothetical protein [Pararobbsia silviterrae]|nr:hypothetical protein [Pararobbsia silviterrae]